MNIQNIAALAEQLLSLGFENAGHSLLKRICFKPDSFFLSQKIEKAKDLLSFQLFFKKDKNQNAYVLMFYDAVLQKQMSLPDLTISDINTSLLEKQMAEIDWKSAFGFDTKKQWSAEDKTSWDKEQKIESIVENLALLEATDEGKIIASALKFKFWSGIPYTELLKNISPLKSKTEVCQRFYFFEEQTGISVDEAYRFLQNRWLEKQVLAKRKQTDDTTVEENESNGRQSSSGNGLLRKKRVSMSKRIKKNKRIQN